MPRGDATTRELDFRGARGTPPEARRLRADQAAGT
jgi:hypothetical protein